MNWAFSSVSLLWASKRVPTMSSPNTQQSSNSATITVACKTANNQNDWYVIPYFRILANIDILGILTDDFCFPPDSIFSYHFFTDPAQHGILFYRNHSARVPSKNDKR